MPAAMFAIRNYGFESLIRQVKDETHSRHQLDRYDGDEACVSCELTDELAGTLKQHCRALACRLCDTLLGEDFMRSLAESGRTLDGRQSLRYYPGSDSLGREGSMALGPHVDGTLFTMLWSDGPGLQVCSTHEAATRSSSAGLPTIGPSITGCVREDEWAEVEQFWEDGMLLVTVGQEWIDLSKGNESKMMTNVKQATLHRVSMPSAPRHSIPFLVRVVSDAESKANCW